MSDDNVTHTPANGSLKSIKMDLGTIVHECKTSPLVTMIAWQLVLTRSTSSQLKAFGRVHIFHHQFHTRLTTIFLSGWLFLQLRTTPPAEVVRDEKKKKKKLLHQMWSELAVGHPNTSSLVDGEASRQLRCGWAAQLHLDCSSLSFPIPWTSIRPDDYTKQLRYVKQLFWTIQHRRRWSVAYSDCFWAPRRRTQHWLIRETCWKVIGYLFEKWFPERIWCSTVENSVTANSSLLSPTGGVNTIPPIQQNPT